MQKQRGKKEQKKEGLKMKKTKGKAKQDNFRKTLGKMEKENLESKEKRRDRK